MRQWWWVFSVLIVTQSAEVPSLTHVTRFTAAWFTNDQITCIGDPCAWLPLCRGPVVCVRVNVTADFACQVPGEAPSDARINELRRAGQWINGREWVTVLQSTVACDTFRADWPGWINVSACRLTLRLLGPATPQPHLAHPLPVCPPAVTPTQQPSLPAFDCVVLVVFVVGFLFYNILNFLRIVLNKV